MKRYVKLCILLLAILTGCNQIDRLTGSKPNLELSNNKLIIRDFQWSYGTIRINQYSGDFEKLDKKVFNTLKGKEGIVSVHLENITKDQYGKDKSEINFIGDINLAELNKYEDWEYWHKASGIKYLINEKYFPKDKTDSSFEPEQVQVNNQENYLDSLSANSDTSDYLFRRSGLKPLKIDQKELYPELEIRTIQDSIGYIEVEGIITVIDYKKGRLIVEGNDGNQYNLLFEIHSLSNDTKNKLEKVLVAGTGIKCSATYFGEKNMVIVQATFNPF